LNILQDYMVSSHKIIFVGSLLCDTVIVHCWEYILVESDE
jgi:hypothetical protein